MDDLERARRLLEGAPGSYAPWKRECEAQVIRWEWSDRCRHHLEPCYFEIHNVLRGRLLPREPAPPTSGAAGHGFDGAGRLIVTRDLTPEPGCFWEELVRYRDDHAELLFFDCREEKEVRRADLLRFEAGRVASISSIAANGNTLMQSFGYDSAGRLVQVERTGRNETYGPLHDFRDLEYDSEGNVARVWWRFPDGKRTIDFERTSSLQ